MPVVEIWLQIGCLKATELFFKEQRLNAISATYQNLVKKKLFLLINDIAFKKDQFSENVYKQK